MNDTYKDTDFFILGLGLEGTSCLAFLDKSESEGHLFATDSQAEKFEKLNASHKIKCLNQDDFIAQIHAVKDAKKAVILRSPGISLDHPSLVAARAKNIPHTTPLSFWLENFAPKRTITITGSKGKSTTVSLLTHLLNKVGLDAYALGNIGESPFTTLFDENSIAVVETSSYQLSDMRYTAPYHSVTSIYRAHTDWHGGTQPYIEAKFSPFIRDNSCQAIIWKELNQYMPDDYGHTQFIEDNVYISQGFLRIMDVLAVKMSDIGERFFRDPLQRTLLQVLTILHQTEWVNMGALLDNLGDYLDDWETLSHRLEVISERDGKFWVDDSLATIPEASLMALDQFPENNVHLLIGGKDNGQDFSDFVSVLNDEEGIHIHCFDPCGENLMTLKPKFASFYHSFEEAVKGAEAKAVANDVILFAPAGPSGPPFNNYKERSAMFKDIATGK